jgi:manganese/zinc/iron transport system permease protein
MLVTRYTRIPQDAALGVVLSVFFGFGLVLLGFIQRLPTSNKAGLDKFLFGQAATLLQQDVITMAVFGAAALACVLLLWKEFKLLSFDPEYAGTLGYPVQRLELLLTALTVVAIVIGLQTVGVVLMSAMLVAPAAAARQWTQRLGVMALLSGVFGAVAGVLGAVVSAQFGNLPTGPTIVLVMSTIVLASLLCAPQRGIVARLVRRARQRVQFAVEALLVHLLHHEGLPEEADEARLSHFVSDLRWSQRFLHRIVRAATHAGYIAQRDATHLTLTPAGREVARRAMLR